MPVGTPRPQAVPRKWELLAMVERRNAARVQNRTPALSSHIRMTEGPIPGRRTIPAGHVQTRQTQTRGGPR
ncbi:hypothetical protein FZ938_24610 [Azospirillum oryzae]|nr:hypothetical protein FZ029_31395 [Azospirillum sp. Sh1]KAA0585529.1 hypothetical protein FZ938_24610 [Azospirillum oryzae]GLR81919.1 hypothetical protein GCM10007856_46100 [Azospirillum oryzae]